jgi:hypothetical protein
LKEEAVRIEERIMTGGINKSNLNNLSR